MCITAKRAILINYSYLLQYHNNNNDSDKLNKVIRFYYTSKLHEDEVLCYLFYMFFDIASYKYKYM